MAESGYGVGMVWCMMQVFGSRFQCQTKATKKIKIRQYL